MSTLAAGYCPDTRQMNSDDALPFLLAAAAGGALWWYVGQLEAAPAGETADALPEDEPAADDGGFFAPVLDAVGYLESYMIPVAASLDDANVRAFLMLIRTGEGTADGAGYTRLFGGGSFAGYTDHPRITVSRSGYTSTAAGAYQILARTWDDLKSTNDLPDFSPASQDKAALILIRRRGALADVKAGRWDAAIRKTNKEWASLPGSPYGQPTLTMSRAKEVLLAYGGLAETGSILV